MIGKTSTALLRVAQTPRLVRQSHKQYWPYFGGNLPVNVGQNRHLLRAKIVLACSLAFGAPWLIMRYNLIRLR
ncbi:cytochrome c oxidase subunit 7C [Brevipalpus obovatus]|uniref:cytochrome c oxidase subunit 7C n=1 Tax=Brevipalpus obovatus TaxID=246614 RepID=UPI003D9DB9FE